MGHASTRILVPQSGAARADCARLPARAELDAAHDERSLLVLACKLAIAVGPHAMAWIGEALDDDENGVRLLVHAGDGSEALTREGVSWSLDELGAGPTGTALRTRVPCVMRDLRREPSSPWRDRLLDLGALSVLSLPLVLDGELFGALTIHSRDPEAFPVDEIGTLAELARCVAQSVGKLRALSDEAARYESERKYQQIFHATRSLMALLDREGRVTDINAAAQRVLASPAEDLAGRPIWELADQPATAEWLRGALDEVARTRAPLTREFSGAIPWCPDATFEVTLSPLLDEMGDVVAVLAEAIEVTAYRRALAATEAQLRAQGPRGSTLPER